VLDAEPGKVTLMLKAKTTASGGETVAVYFADAQGNRKTGWHVSGKMHSGDYTLTVSR